MQNILYPSNKQNLPDIAQCHMECFPGSLATKLGKAYVQQSFDWYLNHPNRFLFHIEEEKKVIGYCGGFVPAKPGDGSSSGMLQHAFNKAIFGLITHPWLIFHSELVPHYPFLWRNIKRRFTGIAKPAVPANNISIPFKPYCGLVVIGVHPSYRGRGVAKKLMEEFERCAEQLKQKQLVLTVKKNNDSALKAYKKSGWFIGDEHPLTYVMKKNLY